MKYLESFINPILLNGLKVLSKDDIVIQKVLERSENERDLINNLISAIFCMLDRHEKQLEVMRKVLEANPELKKIIELRNDTSFLLRDRKNPNEPQTKSTDQKEISK